MAELPALVRDTTVEAKEIYRAIGSLCEGQGIRKVARVFEVDKDEVLGWLMAASAHSEAVSRYMLHDLHLSRVQMDDLYALLSAMKKAAEEEEENEGQPGKKRRRLQTGIPIDQHDSPFG